jgi:dihydroorotate dehydrogenase (fumarate)
MLSAKISDVEFAGYIYNAAGVHNDHIDLLKAIADSQSAAITTKSISVKPWQGNPEPRYLQRLPSTSGSTLNAMGIPNPGIDAMLGYVTDLREYTSKPIIISIFSLGGLHDYTILLDKLEAHKECFDMCEVNVSCPNVVGKPMIAYDFESLENLLILLHSYSFPIGLKLPPYLDSTQFDQVSSLLVKYNIQFITCINSLGNCLVIDTEHESAILKPNQGLGGLGGESIKSLGLGNVWSFYQRLQGTVPIIGVGGVRTGLDAFEYLLAGADAVQIASAFWQEGLGIFDRANKEFEDIMHSHGYSNIASAKGQLKTL